MERSGVRGTSMEDCIKRRMRYKLTEERYPVLENIITLHDLNFCGDSLDFLSSDLLYSPLRKPLCLTKFEETNEFLDARDKEKMRIMIWCFSQSNIRDVLTKRLNQKPFKSYVREMILVWEAFYNDKHDHKNYSSFNHLISILGLEISHRDFRTVKAFIIAINYEMVINSANRKFDSLYPNYVECVELDTSYWENQKIVLGADDLVRSFEV